MSPTKPNVIKRHLLLCRPGFEETLLDELIARFSLDAAVVGRAAVGIAETARLPALKDTVFARQLLPRAMGHQGDDSAAAAKFICDRIDIMTKRGNRQSGQWTLHAFAIDDDASLARAKKISKQVMSHVRERQKEFFGRYVSPDAFADNNRSPADMVIQIYVPAHDSAWLSIATIGDGVSPWEGGFQRMKTLRGAPSRSASKLEEALASLGAHPAPGETAVDLGAAPGGWSFVLARHGAHVQAIDHAELDQKAFKTLKGQVEHVKENGLKYLPLKPVDWMVCDMVMGARDTLTVLNSWQQQGAMNHFIVNIKLPKSNPWPQTAEALALIESFKWRKVMARHLFHDRSEITLMGQK